MMKKTILLDTNFLLIPGEYGVDIFSEIEKIADFPYQLAIVDGTVDELDSIIANQRGKYSRAAQLGKDLIKTKNLNMVRSTSEKTVDDIIVDLAKNDENLIVATQDKELKKCLSNRLIILKQGKYLTFV